MRNGIAGKRIPFLFYENYCVKGNSLYLCKRKQEAWEETNFQNVKLIS